MAAKSTVFGSANCTRKGFWLVLCSLQSAGPLFHFDREMDPMKRVWDCGCARLPRLSRNVLAWLPVPHAVPQPPWVEPPCPCPMPGGRAGAR